GAIFIFCDGDGQHLVFQGDHAAAIQRAAARGAGLMFYHYAVEPPADRGYAEFLDWIGGYFELNHSVNPVWQADFRSLPKHAITRGVKPFQIRDEWYFNIHFRDGMQGITPILTATPQEEMFEGPDGPRSGNADVRSKVGQPQVLVWAYDRPNGGRSVGFTGGHYHLNLGDENFRKIVLNSLVWIARGRVPPDGIAATVTHDELMLNLDPKPAK
ncbi:MAG: ThuA domain-containing protein, partial [Bryobacteraceae bacterium]